MKAFVTGCAGFIGSHLCERLVSEGVKVVGIDTLTDYYNQEIKKENIRSLIANSNFSFIHSNLLSAGWETALDGVEFVFHLAAQPGVRGSWGSQFSLYVENNILATQVLLERIKALKTIKKFVYASSSSVYGQIMEGAVNEEHKTAPYSPYGATKLAGENLCFLYNANFGIPVVSTRLFTVYGPRQRPDMAFAKLIYAGISGNHFPLFGDGNQERDFTFVSDVVQAMWLAATTTAASGVFNVGGGHVVSMNEVIRIVEKTIGSDIQISISGTEKGDVKRTGADISRSRAILGYSPEHSIEDGIREQVKFLQSHLGIYRKSISFS